MIKKEKDSLTLKNVLVLHCKTPAKLCCLQKCWTGADVLFFGLFLKVWHYCFPLFSWILFRVGYKSHNRWKKTKNRVQFFCLRSNINRLSYFRVRDSLTKIFSFQLLFITCKYCFVSSADRDGLNVQWEKCFVSLKNRVRGGCLKSCNYQTKLSKLLYFYLALEYTKY